MSKPPKDCLRLALRVLITEITKETNSADIIEDNLPGVRPEFHAAETWAVGLHRRKASRLARVAAWIEGEIGGATTTPRHDNLILSCPTHDTATTAAKEDRE